MADDKKPTGAQEPIAKRDKADKKVDKKVEKETKKEVVSTNKNLDSLINATKGNASRAEKKADSIVKMGEAQTKIDELRAAGQASAADKMQKSLDASVKLLDGSRTDKQVANRLAELTEIESQSSNLLKLQTANSDKENADNIKGLTGIITKLEDQKKLLDDDTLNKNLERSLKSLGGAFGKDLKGEVKELQDAYNVANEDLKSAIASGDERKEELARQQLAEISKGAESEENRRESNKLNEEANSRLFQIGQSMEDLGDKYDESAGAAARGAGFLAGLVGLALMFVDPETFNAVMTKVIDSVIGIFDTIYAFFTGDWEGFKQGFADNWEAIGALVLGIVAMFGGAIFSKLGTMLKIARGFRLFMMGTFIPTLGAAFTSMMTAMTPIVAAMAPILLPVLAIMALVGGLYLGFKALQGALGPGAGIMDTLKVGLLYFVDFLSMIVNGITFIPRKIIGLLGPRLAKWIMGDDFDTSAIESMAEGLDTNRGATAAAEIKAKNEAQALLDATEKESEIDPMDLTEVPNPVFEELNKPKTTIDGSDILNTSDSNAAANKESGTSVQAVITNATGGTTTTNNVIQSTVSGGRETRATRSMAATFSR